MPVNTGDLKLALVIQATSAQAKAALGEVQAQIAAVNAESGKTAATAAAASDAVVSAAGAEAAAAKATGAAQAERAGFTRQTSDEIAQMVRNSLAAVEADRVASKAAADVALARRAEGAAASTAAKSNAELAAAQTAQMARYTAARAPVLELQQILAKSKLTTAEVAQAELLLDRTQAAGIISAGELKEAFAALDAAKVKDVAATRAQTTANVEANATMNSRSRREMGTLASELAAGNVGHVRTSGLALANDMGVFGALLGPSGLAFTAIAASLGVLAAAFVKGGAEAAKFNQTLLATGGYAQITYTQYRTLAQSMAGGATSIGQAKDALDQLAASGKFSGAALGQAAQAAVDMAALTGISVGQAVASIVRLREDPVRAIQALDEQYHFLSLATLQHIQDLADQDDKEAAANAAEQAYADALRTRATQMQTQLGTLQRVWDSVRSSASFAWDAILGVGRPQSQLGAMGDAYDKLLKMRESVAARMNGSAGIFDYLNAPDAIGGKSTDGMSLQQQLSALDAQLAAARGPMLGAQAKQDAAQAQAAAKQQTEQDGKDALKTLQSLGITLDGVKTKEDKVREAARALFDVYRAGGKLPAGVAFGGPIADQPTGAGWDKIKAQLLGQRGGAVDHSADQLARAGAAAQQDLAQSLAGLQGQLNPTAAIWNTYNKAVEKANADAAAMKAAHLGDAQAIDAQRDAVVQLAGQVRDAALDQKSAAAQQAWESLRRSMESPIDARIDDAIAKIQKLNQMLKDGAGDSEQYKALVQSVGENSVAPLPTYRGIGSSVGGPAGELQKNYQAQTALDTAYREQKLALDQKFDDKDTAQHAAHTAALAKLDNDYKNNNAKIEQARGRLQLDTAAGLFGQLAALSSSHNKKMAMIGKTAAIAQAIIKTYEGATDAYTAMASIPYIGPALGAAAAAVAIAAGMANVAAIRAQPTGGYAEGGYTGPGGKQTVAGFVHAGEVVFSQADVARHGGPAATNALRLRGYADGGFVHPMANAPSPADLGFTAPAPPTFDMQALSTGSAAAAPPQVNVKTVMVLNSDQLAAEILNTPTGTKLVIQHVGNNPMAVQGKWRS